MSSNRVLVACMPKSGSTFLTAMVANMPGLRRVRLVPGHQRREQELSIRLVEEEILKTTLLKALWRQNRESLGGHRPRGFVAQMHVRYSQPTATILEQYEIVPVVLVRNIFDIVVSLRDHIAHTSPFMSMAHVTEEMREWPEERMYHFLADMAVPWYLNFFVCWSTCPTSIMVRYEDMIADPEAVLTRVKAHAGLSGGPGRVRQAVAATQGQKTRMNKGIAGRGELLPSEVRAKIMAYADYYPDIDLTPMGLGRVDSPA